MARRPRGPSAWARAPCRGLERQEPRTVKSGNRILSCVKRASPGYSLGRDTRFRGTIPGQNSEIGLLPPLEADDFIAMLATRATRQGAARCRRERDVTTPASKRLRC